MNNHIQDYYNYKRISGIPESTLYKVNMCMRRSFNFNLMSREYSSDILVIYVKGGLNNGIYYHF